MPIQFWNTQCCVYQADKSDYQVSSLCHVIQETVHAVGPVLV